MTFKKNLLAAATATTVAFAGAGVAAADSSYQGSTVSSIDGSSERITADLTGALGSSDENGNWTLEDSDAALKLIASIGAGVAAVILFAPLIDGAVKDFQEWAGQYIG
ncbi:hypothetical protein [Corynebacterium terpenotabidum]|uniref:Secreted protein n=1 Tax=Corynebacterium terpenotabidum Y-11 TaxID=1200352 RepID=S4XIM5_9CORY|nr:hypothetical protein [Corynebacterium terpenotabidum]AGP31580.1 hypothetical protein A606_09705 [Corynebacterium terpenotabidum Y-11]